MAEGCRWPTREDLSGQDESARAAAIFDPPARPRQRWRALNLKKQ
jgi:hypothetical protein